MRALIVIAGAIVAGTLAACGGGNSCEDAVASAAKVYGFGGASYAQVRDSAIKQCKEEKWPDKMRSCVVSAKTRGDVDSCNKFKEAASGGGAEEYGKKAKRSEAELNLSAIQKSLKANYYEMAAFPTGKADLTPSAPCCDGPNHKCAPNPGEWMNNPIWSALDFEMVDPGYFQYSYESTDGQTAIARAVGDLDCDLTTVTWELRCIVVEGTPSCTVTEPTNRD